MEKFDTPEKLCELLKKSGISEAAIDILKEEEISGSEFLDLSEENLRDMKMKMGQIKKLKKLQQQYNQPTVTSKVSVNLVQSGSILLRSVPFLCTYQQQRDKVVNLSQEGAVVDPERVPWNFESDCHKVN